MRSTLMRTATITLAAAGLTACAAGERLSYVGQTPPMSPIENGAAMTGAPGTEGVSADQAQVARLARAQAIAEARARNANPNSLWRSNSSTFFGDPRAAEIGDILTVSINIADRAQVSNQSARSRAVAEDANLANFFGGEAALDQFFNDAVN
ncbi:MAG: flagellar basal body L-ring protein FlgH, partial [Oceanicaulis sp.]